MEIIGVKDPSLEVNFKQLLLFFDKVYLTSVDRLLWKFKYDCLPDIRENLNQLERDIDFLEKEGYLKVIDSSIFEIIRRNKHLDKRILRNKDFQAAIKIFNESHDSFINRGNYLENKLNYHPEDFYNLEPEIVELGNTESRLMSILLNEIKRRDEVVPIIDAFLPLDLTSKTKLVNVTIEKFPKPNSSISWEKIIDFKENEDSTLKRANLRNWINELAKNPVDPKEFNQKLEYLIIEYEQDLKKNKIDYSTELFKVVLKLPLATIENIVKIKWSDMIDPLFKIKALTSDLMTIERKSRNQQVGYIVKSNRKLKN